MRVGPMTPIVPRPAPSSYVHATRLNELEAGVVAVDTAQAARQPALAPTAVKTSAYTAAVNDLVPVDLTSASVTVTLPAAPADKAQVAVKVVTAGSSHSLTVAASGSDVFNKSAGDTTLTFSLVNQGAILQYKASGAIDDEGFGHAVDPPTDADSAVIGADPDIGIAEFGDPGARRLRLVLVVDADEAEAGIAGEPHQERVLEPAGSTPRGPDVHDMHAVGEIRAGKARLAPFSDRRQRKFRHRLVEQRRRNARGIARAEPEIEEADKRQEDEERKKQPRPPVPDGG